MGLDAGVDRVWLLYWTARDRPVPCSRVPVLAGWADLDRREAEAGITARHPILLDPQYRIDPVLARFLTASRFTWLAEGTREAYAKDYRLFFSFLWQRGKYWHEADPDDLLLAACLSAHRTLINRSAPCAARLSRSVLALGSLAGGEPRRSPTLSLPTAVPTEYEPHTEHLVLAHAVGASRPHAEAVTSLWPGMGVT